MAEMTAKQAIAVLHNNMYQKHIANGEYDYIHPLTDAECKGIESLIQQQQQQIEQQAAEIERLHRMEEALREIATPRTSYFCQVGLTEQQMQAIAKAALEEKP